MVKSLVRLLEVDVGFRTERLLTMDVNLAGEKYVSAGNHAAFYGQVLQRLETLPDAPCGLRTRRKPLCWRLWGVAPGCYLVPLQGTKNLTSPKRPRRTCCLLTSGRK